MADCWWPLNEVLGGVSQPELWDSPCYNRLWCETEMGSGWKSLRTGPSPETRGAAGRPLPPTPRTTAGSPEEVDVTA